MPIQPSGSLQTDPRGAEPRDLATILADIRTEARRMEQSSRGAARLIATVQAIVETYDVFDGCVSLEVVIEMLREALDESKRGVS